MPSKRHLLRGATVVGFFSFLGSVTGILVEISIAAHLGLSRGSDTFYIAFTVPYLITNLITATGQFSLVPFFSSYDRAGRAVDLWHGFSYALNMVALGMTAIAVIGAALAPWIIRGIAPGFTVAQSVMSTHLARWLFFILIPAGTAEVFRSLLFSRHRFAIGSAAGFFRNITVIVFILAGFHRYGDYSIVMGYLAGYGLQLCLLGGEALRSMPVHYSLAFRGAGRSFRQLHGAGASQILAALGWQALVLIERVIASFLPPGTITALSYGLKIMTTIGELLAGSVGTSALPALARAAREAPSAGSAIFRNALEISLVLLTPVIACCLLFPRPIMELLFQRGHFSHEATATMALIFFCYCLSLLFWSAIRLLVYYLFARHEMRSFLGLCGLYYGLTVALDLLYVFGLHLGPKGIPLALLTSAIVACVVAYAQNLAGIREVCDHTLRVLAGKDLAAGLFAAIVMWRLSLWLHPAHGSVHLAFFLCEVCVAGFLVFLGVMAAWKAVPLSRLMEIWSEPTTGVDAI